MVGNMTFEEIIKTMLPDIIWEFDDIYLKLDKIAMEKSGTNFERKIKKGYPQEVSLQKNFLIQQIASAIFIYSKSSNSINSASISSTEGKLLLITSSRASPK